MSQRVFARKCGNCRQRAMEIATIPYDIQIDHDGRKYQVHIPALTVPKCGHCGEISIDTEADKQIDEAFHREADLWTGEQIRNARTRLSLNQQQLADALGIAVSTLSRWETGAQIQQRALDKFLRSFFALPILRSHLECLSASVLSKAN